MTGVFIVWLMAKPGTDLKSNGEDARWKQESDKRIAELQIENEVLKSEIDHQRKKSQLSVQSLEADNRVSELKAKNDALKKELESEQAKPKQGIQLAVADKRITELENENAGLRKQLDVQQTKSPLEVQVAAANKRISDLENENALIKKELEDQRGKPQPVVKQPSIKPLPVTKAEFRKTVMSFKNLSLGYGPVNWNGVNGKGGRNGAVIERAINLPPGIRQVDLGKHYMDYQAAFAKKDFDEAFGTAHHTKTAGQVVVWSWMCSDGTVEVILVPNGSEDKLPFIGIDDR